jgi:hypothetical protein
MVRRKSKSIPRLSIPADATLKEIYAQARAEFSAGDLQKYTEVEPMVPMAQVLRDMEKIHREESRKLRTKRKK